MAVRHKQGCEKMSDSIQTQSIQPLDTCLLVDSRFHSRKQIETDLSKISLFINILDAACMREALAILAQNAPEACIIGPTVTPLRALEFLQMAKKATSEKSKCAYLAIGPEHSPLLIGLKELGINGTITMPYSLDKLSDTIVKTIVLINPDSLWKGNSKQSAIDGEESVFNATLILQRSVESLKELAHGLRLGRFGIAGNGKLTSQTAAALHLIVNTALPQPRSGIPEWKQNQRLLFLLFEKWVRQAAVHGEAKATANLRQQLLN